MPAEYAAVDHNHLAVFELVDRNRVKVAQKPRRDGVTAAAGWSHRSDQLQVGQIDGSRVLQVVPTRRP